MTMNRTIEMYGNHDICLNITKHCGADKFREAVGIGKAAMTAIACKYGAMEQQKRLCQWTDHCSRLLTNKLVMIFTAQ
jgi:hypothetical protein